VPKSFRDLKKAELVAAAVAFATSEEGNAEAIRADLEENGVTWEMYAKAFKLEGYEEEEPVEKFELPAPVDIEQWPDEGGEEVVEQVIITAEQQPQLAPQEKYLIKMTRKNPYFEFEDKKFTQEKPYAIMPAQQAQRILESEEGFRQAYPAELQEFYN
jgi:hypothetical protein